MVNTVFVTKQQLAYDAIKADIINGTYLPGAKLVISRIAKSLDISDIPVRESLKILEAEGVVINKPHVGFEVSTLNYNDAGDVFQVRLLLEGEATRLATKNMTPDVLATVYEKLVAMETATGDLVKAGQLNRAFHQAVYAACGNNFLFNTLTQVSSNTLRAQSVYVLFPGQLPTALKEHRAIYAAIEQGDAEKACLLLRAHKEDSYKLLVTHFV